MNTSILNTSRPSLKGSRVPPGHILVNSKFQGSEILQFIQENGIKPVIQEGLGIVDFYPSNQLAVIWIPEETIISSEASLQKKLRKLSEGFCNGIVFVQITTVSHQYYKRLQLFSLDICNITLVPVPSPRDMAQYVAYLTVNESDSIKAPVGSVLSRNIDDHVLNTVKAIEGVGEKKAKELLRKFTSLAEICDASFEELKNIVGVTAAQSIKSVFEGSS